MNWSSTSDAAFMTETLSTYNADEVFLQLKASSLKDTDYKIPLTLVLRKWHDGHQKAMEFRAYIVNNKLRGL